jgi:inner membrane protein
MQDSLSRATAWTKRSQMLRVLLIGFLVLVLQIPIAMIGRLVSERQQRSQEALLEVTSKWGNTQAITRPALIVPYTHRWTETPANAQPIVRSEVRHAVFLAGSALYAVGARQDSGPATLG